MMVNFGNRQTHPWPDEEHMYYPLNNEHYQKMQPYPRTYHSSDGYATRIAPVALIQLHLRWPTIAQVKVVSDDVMSYVNIDVL